MSCLAINKITDELDVGTRIHWEEGSRNLYFVDVPNSMVYRYDSEKKTTTKAKVGNEPLAFMFPVKGTCNKFIAGLGRKIVFTEWDGTSCSTSNTETIVEVDTEDDVKANRLNGAKVDPFGRLWAGTMGPSDAKGDTVPGKGSLYSLEKGKLKKHECQIGISNGIAWNTQKKKMYYIDTLAPVVFQYDFSDCGEISNKCEVFSFTQNNIGGLPDGLTMDCDGNLYVCAIFGSSLVKFCPDDGKVLQKIDLPTPQPTAITFGGSKLDQMYLTTARIPTQGKVPPSPAGATFLIENIGSTGFAGDAYIP